PFQIKAHRNETVNKPIGVSGLRRGVLYGEGFCWVPGLCTRDLGKRLVSDAFVFLKSAMFNRSDLLVAHDSSIDNKSSTANDNRRRKCIAVGESGTTPICIRHRLPKDIKDGLPIKEILVNFLPGKNCGHHNGAG